MADGNYVSIPNKLIVDNPMKNYSESDTANVLVTCGVGYESDLEQVKILTETTIRKMMQQKELLALPYSPNLNLIERLWKFLRKKVINTGFYRNKTEFRDAIRNFFDNIHTYKKELESLLTLNFRLINSQTISF